MWPETLVVGPSFSWLVKVTPLGVGNWAGSCGEPDIAAGAAPQSAASLSLSESPPPHPATANAAAATTRIDAKERLRMERKPTNAPTELHPRPARPLRGRRRG